MVIHESNLSVLYLTVSYSSVPYLHTNRWSNEAWLCCSQFKCIRRGASPKYVWKPLNTPIPRSAQMPSQIMFASSAKCPTHGTVLGNSKHQISTRNPSFSYLDRATSTSAI